MGKCWSSPVSVARAPSPATWSKFCRRVSLDLDGQERPSPHEQWRAHSVGTSLGDKSKNLHSNPNSFASFFHLLSTRALVLESMRISSGQGRVKPSLAHLRVASMPIFDP
jgi:hypothetical protein